MSPVILVCAPFLALTRPALGVSSLQAVLQRDGVGCSVLYANLRFAERVGVDLCQTLAERLPPRLLAGEWVFSGALYGEAAGSVEGTEAGARWWAGLEQRLDAEAMSGLRRARAAAPAFVADLADEIVAAGPRLVGFSSSFQQNQASLALARAIRARDPSIVLVMGGANCEGPMGPALGRAHPWLDAVFSGEAEHSFPPFVQEVLAGQRPRPRAGLWWAKSEPAQARPQPAQARSQAGGLTLIGRPGVGPAGGPGGAPATTAPPVRDLDALPVPRFDDWFAALAATSFAERIEPAVPFEGSRGCWWGARRHCRFCGLNGGSMVYRSKSAERMRTEIEQLYQRWGVRRFEATDNILDPAHVDAVFGPLAERLPGLRIFYEVKSNLSRRQLHALARGGVTWIQPGIESLQDDVLKLMAKGVSAVQNIALLRNCAELGIRALWNVLWGFPGEGEAHYAEFAALLPLLTHLDPPTGHGRIRLDRFSPFFEKHAEFGFEEVAPAPAYQVVYPLPATTLHEIAYFFEGVAAGTRDRGYLEPALAAVEDWRAAVHGGSSRPVLLRLDAQGSPLVLDTRAVAQSALRPLAPAEDALLRGLRRPRLVERAIDELVEQGWERGALEAARRVASERGWLVERRGHGISLVMEPADRVHGRDAYQDYPGGWLRPMGAAPPPAEPAERSCTAQEVTP